MSQDLHALGHLDDTGTACPHHPPVQLDAVLALALIGTRAPGFNHDLASKLQGLMMTVDELTELVEIRGDGELARVVETAAAALAELDQLLAGQRALSRTTARTRLAVHDLVARAGARVAVGIRGDLGAPEAAVAVVVPAIVHAVSLAIDIAAGQGRGRSLEVGSRLEGAAIELVLPAARPVASNAGEWLAIARAALRREGGELGCSSAGDQIVIRLPLAPA
ncbi:MAG: hypothetical protein ACTHU0_02580 [Kofleriaceae bacterium]